MLETLTIALALQGALFIVVRLATGQGRWPVDVLAPANIETTRTALQWAVIVYGLLWLCTCIAHVTFASFYSSFYLQFGPIHSRWETLLLLQSVALFQTVLCSLAWCGVTLCAMIQAAILHERVNGRI